MFSQQHADSACNFFEKILRHTADDWYGKPFVLAPWQEEALSAIFGNLNEDGTRVIETAYLEVPKKAGKSEFAAGILLLAFILEATPGCQIYGAASAQRQALNVYRACCKMVEQSSILQKRLRVLRGTHRILKRNDPDSFYAAIAADGDLGDGVNPFVTVADEVHRWKTQKQLDNWDVLVNGGITRKQTLTVAITTAGVENESPLAWKLHEKTTKIHKGIVSDPKFYGKIWGAAKEDDPLVDATLIKANPSLKENGGFMDLEKLQARRTTLESEGDLTSWRRYYLNIWDQRANAAIDIQKWDASAGEWKAEGLVSNPPPMMIDGKEIARKCRPLPDAFMKRFVERRCWAGIDLSMTSDLSAVVFLFPGEEGDTFDVLPFFWLPDANIKKLETKLSVPLRRWADEGFLELVRGDVIDYRDVQARLEWGAEMFDVREFSFDPWNSRQISVAMLENGHICKEIRQGFGSLNEATKKIKTLVVQGRLHHGAHPVLRWHAGCAATITDGRDNIMFDKPDRARSASRIDGISALTNAMASAIVADAGVTYSRVRSLN